MGAARAALDDANKKLAAFDKQLEGLASGSEAAKAITAEMAKLVGEINRLEQGTEGFAAQLDALKPGTVGALRAEVEELEAAFERTVIGTAEYDAALLKLGSRKGDLKSLEDSLDALAPKERAAAFVDMAAGLSGVVGVSLAAGEALGLSAQNAERYEQRMQTVLTVVSSFEAISRAVNSESRANIKNLLATAKAYLTGGEAATSSGKAARLAIAGTGIGLLIIALAYVVTNWEKLTKTVAGSEGKFAKFKAVIGGLFDGLITSAIVGAEAITKFVTGDFGGLAATMKGAGKRIGNAYNEGYQESLFEGYKKTIEQQVAFNEQVLKVQQAAGRDTYALQRRILQDKYVLLDKGAADFKKQQTELAGDLAALDRTEQVKQKTAALAAAQARLDGVAALTAAKGNESFRADLAAKKQQLAILTAAAQPDKAAITAKQFEIATLKANNEQQIADKQRAALLARQQAALALEEVQGRYTIELKVEQARELLALDTGTSQKAIEQKKADNAALRQLLAEQAQFEKDLAQKNFEDRQDEQGQVTETNNAIIAAGNEFGTALVAQKTDLQKRIESDLGKSILTTFFGVSPEKVEEVKAALTQAVSEVYGSLQGLASAYLDGALQEADRQVQAAQDRLTLLDQSLQQHEAAAESAQQQVAQSTGARRDYYLGQLAKERAEVQRVASAKAAAAKTEEAATKEKHRLEKIGQQLSAASALATNVAAAASAVYAGIKAVSAGSEIPFPGNVIAIAAGLAAVVAAVSSAKQLSNASKYADGTGALGSDGVLQGPSHGGGGIGLYSRNGHFYGEAEGGEAITPTDATRLNGPVLALLRTAGRTRTLGIADYEAAFARMPRLSASYHVVSPPAGYYPGHYANGTGSLGGGLASTGGASNLADRIGALEAQAARTNELLEQVVSHTGRTADSNQFIAEKPPIVPDHDTALRYQKLAQEVETFAAPVTL